MRRWPAVVGFIDQGVTSAANVLIVFAIGRVSGVSEFGAISILLAIMAGLLGAFGGLFGLPMAVLSSESQRVREELRMVFGAGLIGGAGIALLGVVIGCFYDSWVFVAISLGVPAFLSQEGLRYGAISLGRPSVALIADSTRLLVALTLFVSTFASPSLSAAEVISFWMAAGIISALTASMMLKCSPAFNGQASWLRTRLGERLSFGFDSVLASVTSVLYTTILGITLGPAGVAGLRAAGTLLGPFNTLSTAMSVVMVPRLVSRKGSSGAMALSLMPIGALMMLVALVAGSTGLWLPESIGRGLLGETWSAAKLVLPIMGIEYALLAVRSCLETVLKASIAVSQLLFSRIVLSFLMLGVAAVIPVAGGPQAVAVAMVVVAAISSGLLVWQLKRLR